MGMDSTGKIKFWTVKDLSFEVGSFSLLYIFFSKFETTSFSSLWLEISIYWHTKSQGPLKKCSHFTKVRVHPCAVHTTCNKGSFTPKNLVLFNPFFPNCKPIRILRGFYSKVAIKVTNRSLVLNFWSIQNPIFLS